MIKTKARQSSQVRSAPELRPDNPDFTLLQLQSELEQSHEGGDRIASLRKIGCFLTQKQRYAEAVPVYEALLALDSTSVQTQATLARCLERLGRWSEAAARYQLVVAADPERPDVLVGMGLCMLRQDMHVAALSAFDRCLHLQPQHVGALLGKATCLRLTGRTSEANSVYREALRVQPEIASALDSLIAGTDEASPPIESAAGSRIAASSAAGSPAAASAMLGSNVIGSSLAELENIIAAAVAAEDFATAAEHCRALTQLAPDYYEAWFNLGVFEQHASNLTAAVDAFRNAVALQPLDLEPLQALAQVYHLQGEMKAAEASYRAALALAPDSPELLWNIGIVLEQRGDLAGAEQSYSRIVKGDQDRGEAWFRLGFMRLQLDDSEGAVVAFRRALDLGAKTFESAYNLGLAYWKLDRTAQSSECFRAALRMQTNFAPAHRGLAALALREGDDSRARDLHRDLVERGDNSVEILFNLAVFEHRANRLHSAIEYYKQALKVDASLAGASAGLALAQSTLSARRHK